MWSHILLLLLLALQPTVGFSLLSVFFFHSALSLQNFLHPLIPIICTSSSTSSIHLFLGLPLFLLPVGFHSSTLLCIRFPSIRITWPSQAILLLFTNLTISSFFIRSFSSQFILILQNPSSFCTVPKIFLNILLSSILRYCSMWSHIT